MFLMILNALSGRSLPVYGDGAQIRVWLYVVDHARALFEVATKANSGQTYNSLGHNELTNIDVVNSICDILNALGPEKSHSFRSYRDLIIFAADRPVHYKCYAIHAKKNELDLNGKPR